MSQVTDKKISKVYEGKVLEGKGQYFNFYLEGGKKKYGYFVAKGKTPPEEGMKVALLEYETKQDGEYENNKVTKLVWMGAGTSSVSAKAPENGKTDKSSPLWFVMSYAKDLQIARIQSGQSDPNLSLIELGIEVASVAIDMLRFIEHPADLLPKQKEEPQQGEAQQPVPIDDIPF